MHIPEWTLTFLILFVLIGFPIALAITWAFEIGADRKVAKTTKPESKISSELLEEQPTPQTSEAKIKAEAAVTPFRRRKVLIVASGIITTILLTFLIYYVTGWGRTTDALSDRSIAVIPFKLIGTDQEGKYFAEGVADALINHLHDIKDLKVRSRTSVEKYAGSLKTIPEIGTELGVQYILEGSAQKYKDNIRIIVQLINAKTDDHIWFKEYDENFDDIFKIQSEIALNIASELNVKLASSQKKQVEKIPTTNSEAWDFYLRGDEYTRNYFKYLDDKDLKLASDFFKKAIQKDANFAMAYTKLASVSWRIPKDSLLLLINKSIQLDPDLPNNYEQLGYYYVGEREYEKAIRNYEKAITMDPLQNFVMSLGRVYAAKNDHLTALSYYNEAFHKEKSGYYQTLLYETGVSYMCIDELVLAEKFMDAALKIEPDNLIFLDKKEQIQMAAGDIDGMLQTDGRSLLIKNNWALRLIGTAWLLKKDYVKSEAAYHTFFYDDFHPYHIDEKIFYAFVSRKLGKKDQALALIATVNTEIKQNGNDRDYFQAKVYAFNGEKSKALDYLEKFTPNVGIKNRIDKDPVFEGLKNEPRFKALVNRINARYEEQRKQAEAKIVAGKFPGLDLIGGN